VAGHVGEREVGRAVDRDLTGYGGCVAWRSAARSQGSMSRAVGAYAYPRGAQSHSQSHTRTSGASPYSRIQMLRASLMASCATSTGEHLVQMRPMWSSLGGSCSAMCWPARAGGEAGCAVRAALGAGVDWHLRVARPVPVKGVQQDGSGQWGAAACLPSALHARECQRLSGKCAACLAARAQGAARSSAKCPRCCNLSHRAGLRSAARSAALRRLPQRGV
jgi:hypothetical protein